MIRRSTLVVTEILGGLIGLFIVLGGLLIWRVTLPEPMHLKFLTPYIEQALTPPNGTMGVRIGDTRLSWGGWQRNFEIIGHDVTVVEASSGRRLGAVSQVSITLSFRALIHGIIAPTDVTFIRPRLTLVRGLDGAITLNMTPAEETEAGAAAQTPTAPGTDRADILHSLVGALTSPPDYSKPSGYFRDLEIENANITLDDRRTGRAWHSSSATLQFRRAPGGVSGDVLVELDQLATPARLHAHIAYRLGSGQIPVSADFQNLDPVNLGQRIPELRRLGELHLLLNGSLKTDLGLDLDHGDIDFNVYGGPGSVVVPDLIDGPVAIVSVAATGRLSADYDRFELTSSRLGLGPTNLALTGAVNGLARPGTDIAIDGRATIDTLSVDDLKHLWPKGAAAGARGWVAENISAGAARNGSVVLKMRLPAGDISQAVVDTLDGRFDAQDLTIRYWTPLAPLTGVVGSATLNAREFDAAITGGAVDAIKVDGAKVAIAGLDGPEQIVKVDGKIKGPLRDILTLIDAKPLGYPAKVGIDPKKTAGEVAGTLSIELPAIDDLPFEKINLAIKAAATKVRIDKLLFGADATSDSLDVTLDTKGMRVKGAVSLDAVDADVEWQEFFTGAALARRIQAKLSTDSAERAKLGLDLAPYVEGPVPGAIVYSGYSGGKATLEADLDLNAAKLAVPLFKFEKPPGRPANLKLTADLKNNLVLRLRDIDLNAEKVKLTGEVALDADGKSVKQITIPSLVIGQSMLKDLTANRDARGALAITLGDGVIDAAPFMKTSPATPAAGKEKTPAKELKRGTPFRVDAPRLARVILGPGRELTNASISVSNDGLYWDVIKAKATLPGGAPLTFRFEPGDPGTHRLEITSEDAGQILKALDIVDSVVGGKFKATGVTDDKDPDRPLKAEANARDFRVVKASLLARLLTAATLTGIVDALAGEGINFSRFTATFTKRNGMIEVPLARAYGNSLGLTAKGTLDFDADTIDAQGTIVPAYAVNRVLNNIPVLGYLLTGGEGQGMFAATYRMSGSLEDPKISINPLSALAPGFLRGLFDVLDPSKPGEAPKATPLPDNQTK